MKNKQCSFIKANKTLCNAKPVKGSTLCFRHNPLFQEAQLVASSKGGRNRRLQGVYGHDITLKTPDDIQLFLGTVINAVWTGKVPVPVGSSMGFLTRCWLDAHEATEVQIRLDNLEKKLEGFNNGHK